MNTPDLITIFGNLSKSLYPVQHLITGFAYLLGIAFFISSITKFFKMADHRARSSSHERAFVPLMYMLMGAALIYLPSTLQTMANTAFGVGNVLTYNYSNPSDIKNSIGLLIRTAGLVWFVRGCALLVTASQPGTQQGPKGLAFLVAGVFAMNFDNSMAFVNSMLSYLTKVTLAVKASQGF